MHRKFSKIAALAGISVLGAAAIAVATVTFDPNTGTGFVGKGDVQLAFGWNDAALQQNAGGVTFTYDVSQSASYDCVWDTTTGGPNPQVIHHSVTHNRSTVVNDSIAYEARKNSQGKITGFNLNGFGSTSESGDTIPNEGDLCPEGGAGTGATVQNLQLGSATGGLFVHYGGTAVQIG